MLQDVLMQFIYLYSRMKWLFILVLFISSSVVAQNYGDKKYYLVDSVDLDDLSPDDIKIINESLKKYHKAKQDTSRINALKTICEEMSHDDWMKYQEYQYKLIQSALAKKTNPEVKQSLKKSLSEALNNLGYIHSQKGDLATSQDYHYKSLKVCEEIGYELGKAISYNQLGVIYEKLGEIETALDCYKKSLAISKRIGDDLNTAISYNNLGVIYSVKKDDSKALEYYKKSLEIKEQLGESSSAAQSLQNIGSIYATIGELDKASDYLNRSLKLREGFNDKLGIAQSLCELAEIDLTRNNIIDAKIKLERALPLAQQSGSPEWISKCALDLSNVYEKLNQDNKALDYYKLYVAMRDSVNNNEVLRQTVKQQIKFDYEKQKAIDDINHEKEIAIGLEEKKNQRIIIDTSIFGLVLVVVFLIYANNKLRITKRQKAIIEVQKDEIVDSINYAKRLQEAILPQQNELFANLKQGFLLYLPKDIVAGDFYWMHHQRNYHYIAVADCTGHGVPGALVSVVCATALDRAVKEFDLTETNEILDKTRTLVVETFERSGEDVKDGMDISLARVNFSTNEIQFSGAFNPLWIIPKEGDVQILRGDRQPIGKVETPKTFTAHTHILHAGDWVIQFSDGFADQFGGEKGKKYGAAQLKQKLIALNQKSAEEFKSELASEFNKWKGTEEQLDDVCVVGWQLH